MKSFLLKLLLFSIPVLVPALLYVIIDPFKVIYNYPDPINTNKNYQVAWNRDYQSTETFLNNYKGNNYNSFIMGNSRSIFYQATTWNQLIEGNCFHLNAYNESLYGINTKLKLLDKLDVDIKNAVIILDFETFSAPVANSTGHLFIKHPACTGESRIAFQFENFKGFASKAMITYVDLFFTGVKKPYMELYGVTGNIWKFNPKTNQLKYFVYDRQIDSNPDLYYKDKMYLFDKRPLKQLFYKQCIGAEQKKSLENSYAILQKHKTNYKIIISPVYDQFKLNDKDLNYIKGLFGVQNVFDFAGINSITNNYRNYYEKAHYRPNVCDSLLRVIYKQ